MRSTDHDRSSGSISGSNPGGIAERILILLTRRPEKALTMGSRALRTWNRRDPLLERGRLERAYAHALRAVGRYRQARNAYFRSRRTFAQADRPFERAVCAIGLVDACTHLGRFQEALRVAREARTVLLRQGDRVRLAKLETNVGNLYHKLDDIKGALTRYERAAKLLEPDGSSLDRARLNHNLANILTSLGRRREAEALYIGAQETFAAEGEHVLAAQARYGIACLRFLTGEYAAAVTALEEVRLELRRLGARPLLALADLDLAEALLALRLYPEALALAENAHRWFRMRSVPVERAKCELILGITRGSLGNHRAADRSLAAADRAFRARGHHPGRAAVALARAQMLRSQGLHPGASWKALWARRILRRAGFRLRALAAGALAAEVLLEDGRVSRAEALARKLLAEPPLPGNAYSRARLERILGAAASLRGDIGAALHHYRRALAETDRALASVFVDEWRIGFVDEEPPIFDEFLGALLRREPRPSAIEIWRWIARRSKRTPLAVPGSVAPSPMVQETMAGLRAELEACYARLWRLRTDHNQRVLPAPAATLEHRMHRIEGRLRRLAGGWARPLPREDLEYQKHPQCPSGEVQLFYFTAGGTLGVVRVDSTGAALITNLATIEDVGRAVRLFHYQMETRGSWPQLGTHRSVLEKRASGHLARLGRLVLEPAFEGVVGPVSRVRIRPVGTLQRLPFHALPWRGRALIETAEVSLDLGRGFPVDSLPSGRSGGLVLGFDAEGSEERAIDSEARAVGALLGSSGVAVEVRTGTGAGWEVLVRSAPHVAVLHLVGHAVYRAEHPEFSALRVADRWVSVSDVAALPLRGACVVLSACETGPRGVVAGTESLGLVRGFLRAGAAAVVATLWRVNDRETGTLMCDLHAAWRKAGTLGAALREVQAGRASSREDLYFWAAFTLIGSPRIDWPSSWGKPQ